MDSSEDSDLKHIQINEDENLLDLFGPNDENIRLLESAFNVTIVIRNSHITISGAQRDIRHVARIINESRNLMARGFKITRNDLKQAISATFEGNGGKIAELFQKILYIPGKKRTIQPRSFMQKEYLRFIEENHITFCIGPAGTGKTYLAMAMAVIMLLNKRVNRIILVRPAVEAGEKLGFLPGDFEEKVHPYLRPLYDALYDMMDAERAVRLIHRGDIEIAPIAYMRGRTLNDSFIIIDEAQNTTSEQMKMCLTRIGFNSKTVITGDITQIDLPKDRLSGLVEVQTILKGINGIKFIYFTEKDVVRHDLIQKIITAYDKYSTQKNTKILT
jgi:phosphate starvation-inducible PhoH-like protein